MMMTYSNNYFTHFSCFLITSTIYMSLPINMSLSLLYASLSLCGPGDLLLTSLHLHCLLVPMIVTSGSSCVLL